MSFSPPPPANRFSTVAFNSWHGSKREGKSSVVGLIIFLYSVSGCVTGTWENLKTTCVSVSHCCLLWDRVSCSVLRASEWLAFDFQEFSSLCLCLPVAALGLQMGTNTPNLLKSSHLPSQPSPQPHVSLFILRVLQRAKQKVKLLSLYAAKANGVRGSSRSCCSRDRSLPWASAPSGPHYVATQFFQCCNCTESHKIHVVFTGCSCVAQNLGVVNPVKGQHYSHLQFQTGFILVPIVG